MLAAVPPVDPNWLLSTTAQSSAALVGIIGGLLVSRLVALSSERSGLLLRQRELTEEISRLRREVDDVARHERDDERRGLQASVLAVVFEHRGQQASEDLVDRFVPAGDAAVTGDRRALVVEVVDEVVEVVKHAFAEAMRAYQEGTLDPDNLPKSGISPRQGWDDVYREAAIQQAQVALGPPPIRHQASNLEVNRARSLRAEQAARPETQPGVDRELVQKEAERAIVSTSIARLGGVSSMTGVLRVLGAFALVGVVQPLVLLAWHPVPRGPWIRGWIVVSFTAALLTLLWFLWREVAALRGRPGADAAAAITSGATAG